MREHQGSRMADTTKSTRNSQWKNYLNFCQDLELIPLPATLDTILLYIPFMSECFMYVTIINYLSAVWVLHKLNGFDHVDPSSFEIKITLKGIRRRLGDSQVHARPITVSDLRKIYDVLDISSTEDLAFWCAFILCFRALLRKSNVVELELSLKVHDVEFHSWGVLLIV